MVTVVCKGYIGTYSQNITHVLQINTVVTAYLYLMDLLPKEKQYIAKILVLQEC